MNFLMAFTLHSLLVLRSSLSQEVMSRFFLPYSFGRARNSFLYLFSANRCEVRPVLCPYCYCVHHLSPIFYGGASGVI